MKVTPPVAYGFVAALGGPAAPGDKVEVSPEVGAQLVAQGWREVVAPAAKKAAPAAPKKESN